MDGSGDNPLPASIEVRLQPGPGASGGVDALGSQLRQMPGVADVRYDRQWLNRVLSAIAVIRGVGLVLGGDPDVAAALTVANVVRLALYARRDEIEIMQLVGAPQALHPRPVRDGRRAPGRRGRARWRWPRWAWRSSRCAARYLTPLASAMNLTSIHFLPVELCFLLVVGGMAVGCLGGLVARLERVSSVVTES